MLDGGKTPLKVVHTRPAVRLLAAKMAALQLLRRAAQNEFPQLVTLFGRAILSKHFSCFGN
jgi:hypothetical protein